MLSIQHYKEVLVSHSWFWSPHGYLPPTHTYTHTQVDVVYTDSTNSSITLRMSWLPYVEIPLDTSSCPQPASTSLVDTCALMQDLADNITDSSLRVLTCSAPSLRPAVCDQILCHNVSSNSTFAITVLSCHAPPAVQLLSRSSAGEVLFNQTFSEGKTTLRANITDTAFGIEVVVQQHTSELTLGVAVSKAGLVVCMEPAERDGSQLLTNSTNGVVFLRACRVDFTSHGIPMAVVTGYYWLVVQLATHCSLCTTQIIYFTLWHHGRSMWSEINCMLASSPASQEEGGERERTYSQTSLIRVPWD